MTLTLSSQSIHPLLIASQDVLLTLQTSSHEHRHPTSPTHIAQRREHLPTPPFLCLTYRLSAIGLPSLSFSFLT